MRKSSWLHFFKQLSLFGLLCLVSLEALSGHPAEGGMVEMEHPSEPLPNGALTPTISFEISSDSMDGYNLVLTTSNFNLVAPLEGVAEYIEQRDGLLMQGHIHLYINGKKMMRVYGHAVHVPASWTKAGINSITLSVNNHRHGTFTFMEKEVQSTLIIDTNTDGLVKSAYRWPSVAR